MTPDDKPAPRGRKPLTAEESLRDIREAMDKLDVARKALVDDGGQAAGGSPTRTSAAGRRRRRRHPSTRP